MGLLEGILRSVGNVVEKSNNDIAVNMRKYRYYSKKELENIVMNNRMNLQQRTAANNLINGEHLHLLDTDYNPNKNNIYKDIADHMKQNKKKNNDDDE